LKKRVAGSNFGLSSIRERMAAMGGWLEEDSTIGRGTTMTLGLSLQPCRQVNLSVQRVHFSVIG